MAEYYRKIPKSKHPIQKFRPRETQIQEISEIVPGKKYRAHYAGGIISKITCIKGPYIKGPYQDKNKSWWFNCVYRNSLRQRKKEKFSLADCGVTLYPQGGRNITNWLEKIN